MSQSVASITCQKCKGGCLQVSPALSYWVAIAYESPQLRPYTLQSRDKPFLLCPVWVPGPWNPVEKKILWPARKKNFPLVLLTASLVILREGKSHSTFSFMPQECERVKWAPRTLWLIITLKMSGWQMAIENTHNHADSCLHMCHMWSSNWIKRTTEATSKSFQRIWNCDLLCLIFLYPGPSIDKICPAHACFHNVVKYKYFL